MSKLQIILRNFDKENQGDFDINETARLKSGLNWEPPHSLLTKYILEMTSSGDEDPRRTMDRSSIVFKLFKDDVVIIDSVMVDWGKEIDIPPHYVHWLDEDRGQPLYFIKAGEEEQFKQFWNQNITIDPKNFAAARFQRADFNPYSEERLIDYVLAMEYLLVPDSGDGEITNKFKMAGAHILGMGKDTATKRSIFDALGEIYSLRSAIVHGDDKKLKNKMKNKKWEEVMKPIRGYTRDLIIFFHKNSCLDNGDKRGKLIKDLILQ